MNAELFSSFTELFFDGLTDEEQNTASQKLKMKIGMYGKDSPVLHAGQTTTKFGIVTEGSVRIEYCDSDGNRTILSIAKKGDCFAESYAMLSKVPLLVDVVANERCVIAFLDTQHLTEYIRDGERWAGIVAGNLLILSTRKNIALSERSFFTAPKKIRDRVMNYLYSVSYRLKSNEFDIPFDRQQLADYLNVERSALSKELGRMEKDGLIRKRKNHFILTGDM